MARDCKHQCVAAGPSRRLIAASSCVAGSLLACGSSTTAAPSGAAAGVTSDRSTAAPTPALDGASTASSGAANPAQDASPSVDGEALGCDHRVANPSCWSTFDVADFLAAQPAFFGGAFDGRYVVFVNGGSAASDPIARYDTKAPFDSASSWSTFDVAPLNADAWGFAGGAFDGRNVYLAPNLASFNDAVTARHSIAVRYDSLAPFGSAPSWATFDLTTANGTRSPGPVAGFVGAVFDGRYVYFVPNGGGLDASDVRTSSGLVARLDTTGAFDDPTSWSSFDTAAVTSAPAADAVPSGSPCGFEGGVFDGRYVYLAPYACGGTQGAGAGGIASSGAVTRFDTQAEFGDAGSWSVFDLATVNADAVGFAGAAFDGRYVYLAPASDAEGAFDPVAARYDTQAVFSDPGAWSMFDARALQESALSAWSYAGAVFDGQFVDFVPAEGAPLLRYDVSGAFADSASWSAFDLGAVDPAAASFAGGVFDGEYLYLVPTGYSPALRFDVGPSPSPLPPSAPGGSFF